MPGTKAGAEKNTGRIAITETPGGNGRGRVVRDVVRGTLRISRVKNRKGILTRLSRLKIHGKKGLQNRGEIRYKNPVGILKSNSLGK